MVETMSGLDLIYNDGRKNYHEYITTIITKNYKIIESIKANPSLISSDVNEDDTLEITQDKPYNLFIKSKKKAYKLGTNTYLNQACHSTFSPVYLITTDCGHVISSVTLQGGR